MVVRKGDFSAVMFGKILTDEQRKAWYGMWKGDLPIVFMKSHGRLVLV